MLRLLALNKTNGKTEERTIIKQTIGFLGAGNMAEAMMKGMITSKQISPNQIIVTNRQNAERLSELEERYGLRTAKREKFPYKPLTVLFLAMKPKDAENVLLSIRPHLSKGTVVASVMAGISLEFMESRLPKGQPVVRVMPNTSSGIGESATAMSVGTSVTAEQELEIEEVLLTMGKVFTIKEDQMDLFTGIAGSGPAYFYYMMENMQKVGEEAGWDDELVQELCAQTILGAAQMVLQGSDSPTELRKKVTSPNGTTAAGLEALHQNGGGKAIQEAILGAASRSEEIQQQLAQLLKKTS
ncbi:pyrroline-5-carboxylate reductase [Mangrovibacillus cuniculi]|uniref:Pyrroline-5-carboxylate reductase n=1 Tax=Mangrovibacillus cuniculi TaxID=2593652 RepID=A0A7S8CAP8_9BACI|nr:pyrroline-5-carboxylate reductase [Mangrovibacillus cuniculi]QPC46516.1 pyrroline-5-carboxylate reductase [Mangrovibacillus cuniculi]